MLSENRRVEAEFIDSHRDRKKHHYPEISTREPTLQQQQVTSYTSVARTRRVPSHYQRYTSGWPHRPEDPVLLLH